MCTFKDQMTFKIITNNILLTEAPNKIWSSREHGKSWNYEPVIPGIFLPLKISVTLEWTRNRSGNWDELHARIIRASKGGGESRYWFSPEGFGISHWRDRHMTSCAGWDRDEGEVINFHSIWVITALQVFCRGSFPWLIALLVENSSTGVESDLNNHHNNDDVFRCCRRRGRVSVANSLCFDGMYWSSVFYKWPV